ncbi:hypothetical protein ID866_6752 [Astraeus odoratus]|nr:hypothetical protein ID866_6752 [Astraeus odoratus]
MGSNPVVAKRAAQPKKKTMGGLFVRPPESSASGGGKKKISAFNKFMQNEMARLKDAEPDMPHQDRFKLAATNWKKAKENPAATAT